MATVIRGKAHIDARETEDALGRLRTDMGSILGNISEANIRALPESIRARAVVPASLWDIDDVAHVYAWFLGSVGHELADACGWDPDLWAAPAPLIMTLQDGDLILTTNRAARARLADDVLIRPHLQPHSPSQWRVEPAVSLLEPLRAACRDVGALVCENAAKRLRELPAPTEEPHVSPLPPPAAPKAPLRPRADEKPALVDALPNGDILVTCDATSTVASIMRGTGGRWVEKRQAWVLPRNKLRQAAELLDSRFVEPTDAARKAISAAIGPFDYDGTLDGLRGVPLEALTSVSDRARERFRKFGIDSAYDLLMHTPRRYLDRSRIHRIRDVKPGEEVAIIGNIKKVDVHRSRRMVKFTISDTTGSLPITFFNAIWQARRFKVGDRVIALGKVDQWQGKSSRVTQMTNPILDPIDDSTIPVIPVYPQSAKAQVSTWELHQATSEVIDRLGKMIDPLPADIQERRGLTNRAASLRSVHLPESISEAESARNRLVYDEFFRLQLSLLQARHTTGVAAGVTHTPTDELTGRVISALPFPLTRAQQRVWRSIRDDLTRPHPMHRLVQGDVGSGKTLIALLTLLASVEGGHQGALMAPTEILASQLYAELESRLAAAKLNDRVPVALLTSKTRIRERRAILDNLASGALAIVVGTHSLLSDDITFHSLGAVVVDEQHRFGVEQRATIRDKGNAAFTPDMLVMTATPIPRTAAITAFGDLDVSIIDELPPGRTPIETVWHNTDIDVTDRDAWPWNLIREQVSQGRQAFVVCPLVEGSEKLQAASATETFEELQHGALHGLRVGLVHGQQRPVDRDETMSAFKAGELDVIVSTTVIEVGVNIPNATCMVILDAARFGMAQLHQLRGRVGRGSHASYCFLVGRAVTEDGRSRLNALCESTDGFYLSEVDLKLRGAGNILGSEQSGGISDLRVADLLGDAEVLEWAREDAETIIATDPGLQRRPLLKNEVIAAVTPETAAWLFKS